MSIAIVITILACTAIMVSLLAVYVIKNKTRKKQNRVYLYFSLLVSKYQLTISGQELIKDHMIGLDGINRKIIVLSGITTGKLHPLIIDLADVRFCFLRKNYTPVKAGNRKNIKLDYMFEKILLRFEFKDHQKPVEIIFYDHLKNEIKDISHLENKAKHWETLLSKMLVMPYLKSA
jgi:hypothetical protein